MNDLEAYAKVFEGVRPWSGKLPARFTVDFIGTLTDLKFRTLFAVDPAMVGGQHVQTRLPTISDGEGWFEAVNWVEAARAARERFVMITLGACYGAQAVGCYRALQLLNPMPSKFVAVEGDPENVAWMEAHMRDNGMDPADHWLVEAAISDRHTPVLFPIGWPGMGIQNCYSSNEDAARKNYADQIIASGQTEEAVRSILLHNSTGIMKNMVPGQDFQCEIKFVSAVTLRDILSPFEIVDYLESDIQQSEILVFPPFMDLLKRKVRRIHVGTHGAEVHETLSGLFQKDGWDVVFNFAPNGSYDSPLGRFTTNDGVLTVRNPRPVTGMYPVADAISHDLLPGLRASRLWGMLGWDDIRQRYRRSVIGPFWITISMSLFILLLGAIYARLFNIDIATYLPFLTLGYIVWGFISTTTTESCRAFQEGERIIKQIKLPYTIYVLRVVWRNFIIFLHTIVIFIPVAIIFNVKPGLVSLLAIPGLALVYLNQVWVAFVLAILGSRYRDLIPIVVTAVQILMFATPILWPVSALGGATFIADINPLYHLIELVRAPMLGTAPAALSWVVSIGMAVAGSALAVALLARASRRLVFWI